MSDNNTCICPYNKSHIICSKKFPHHLIKCKKNYPDIQLQTCPYNATHMMPMKELEQHIRECEDNRFIEGWRYKREQQIHGDLSAAPFDVEHVNSSDDEDWNQDYADSAIDTNSVRSENILFDEDSLFKKNESTAGRRLSVVVSKHTSPDN